MRRNAPGTWQEYYMHSESVIYEDMNVVGVSNPLGSEKPTSSQFDFYAKECHKSDPPANPTTAPRTCQGSPEDD
ncbi:hypothetical protein TNCV_4852971 [Trichonephila clavipes]|nr:hypothetical protein TNCV_4852971 [Trichonephila clavipes]